MPIINPVLLAGGSGTRLWPLSRKSYPKQFSNLISDSTLFQSSAKLLTSSSILKFDKHITVTNADYRFIIREQLHNIGIDPGPILIEPETKNTAAAILAASVFACSKDPAAVMLVAPSDHVIPDQIAFHKAVNTGLKHVQNQKIVTFGIKPTHPETGYGYLELSMDQIDSDDTFELLSFIEKPNLKFAKEMVQNGNYLWNAGIFLFRARDMIDAFSAYMPTTLDFVQQAVRDASIDLDFLRLAAVPWSMLDDISVDYAIMEKARNLVAVSFASKWSDVGGWGAVWSESASDQLGNVTSQSAHAIDCTNSLLRSESSGQQVVGIGLENIMAIAMPDAVLIVHKDKAQDVKNAVSLLKEKGIEQAEIFPKDHRPWGWFESLTLGDKFQVKRICVNPGSALSLQSHDFRSEHWVVVEGTATVEIDQETKELKEGQSVYVPLGSRHRLSNLEHSPLTLIEVQIGGYLGEDDIIRYDDAYGRKEIQ